MLNMWQLFPHLFLWMHIHRWRHTTAYTKTVTFKCKEITRHPSCSQIPWKLRVDSECFHNTQSKWGMNQSECLTWMKQGQRWSITAKFTSSPKIRNQNQFHESKRPWSSGIRCVLVHSLLQFPWSSLAVTMAEQQSRFLHILWQMYKDH